MADFTNPSAYVFLADFKSNLCLLQSTITFFKHKNLPCKYSSFSCKHYTHACCESLKVKTIHWFYVVVFFFCTEMIDCFLNTFVCVFKQVQHTETLKYCVFMAHWTMAIGTWIEFPYGLVCKWKSRHVNLEYVSKKY